MPILCSSVDRGLVEAHQLVHKQPEGNLQMTVARSAVQDCSGAPQGQVFVESLEDVKAVVHCGDTQFDPIDRGLVGFKIADELLDDLEMAACDRTDDGPSATSPWSEITHSTISRWPCLVADSVA